MKNVISTDKAPAAIGPYSQAIEVNGMVYTSGIIPVVPATGEIPEGSVAQAKQALTNLSHLLEAAGTSMANVGMNPKPPLSWAAWVERTVQKAKRWLVGHLPPGRSIIPKMEPL